MPDERATTATPSVPAGVEPGLIEVKARGPREAGVTAGHDLPRGAGRLVPPPGLDLVVMWDDKPQTSFTLPRQGMQEALAKLGVRAAHRQRTNFSRQIGRVLGKAKMLRPIAPRRGQSITLLTWASDREAFPDTYWREIVPWIYDCWGPWFPKWEIMLRRHRIRTAFFSARQTAAHFARLIPGLSTHWVPEACEPSVFRPGKPLRVRSLHVLEMGRKWEWLHDQITGPLEKAGKTHKYATQGSKSILFPGVDGLYAGLADTAVMICYPKTVTHPEEAGGVETLTYRYYETIGSGCLPVGHAPQELVDLFGFNPVIELSTDDPAGHILDILNNLGRHQELVDRALARLKEVGTFEQSARMMLMALGWQPA